MHCPSRRRRWRRSVKLFRRQLSIGTACTRVVGTNRSTAKIMQEARKLVLVDEFDKEYKRLQRPADAIAKTVAIAIGKMRQTSYRLRVGVRQKCFKR